MTNIVGFCTMDVAIDDNGICEVNIHMTHPLLCLLKDVSELRLLSPTKGECISFPDCMRK